MQENTAKVAADTAAVAAAVKAKQDKEELAFLYSNYLAITKEDVDETSKAYYAA